MKGKRGSKGAEVEEKPGRGYINQSVLFQGIIGFTFQSEDSHQASLLELKRWFRDVTLSLKE
jgi:hypothetical protein